MCTADLAQNEPGRESLIFDLCHKAEKRRPQGRETCTVYKPFIYLVFLFSFSALENEALSSLHAALDLKKEGKNEKALRLFQHAVSLAPKHPDVLNQYGEFLEDTQKDVMAADQLYFQALTYCPTHSRALTNRLRTASVVEEMDEDLFKRIDAKRDILAAIPDTNRALNRAKKEAYFQVSTY